MPHVYTSRGKIVLGGSLLLLTIGGFHLPKSHAQMRYDGGFTPSRRGTDDDSPPTTVPKPKAPPTPKTPRDYFPDGDFGYLTMLPATGNGDSTSAPVRRSLFGIAPSDLPWNQPGFRDYDEPLRLPSDTSLSKPKKYSVGVSLFSPVVPPGPSDTAILIARVPETAVFWVEGKPTNSTGRMRYFRSPPLAPGRKYKYTVRVAWIEEDRWVSQTQTIPVQAGAILAIYLQRTGEKAQKP